MKRRSFKMRVVESTATLVLSIIAAALLWCLTGVNNLLNWAGFLLALLAMLAVRHMSNGNALMRVRTWMVPSTFILLSGAVFSIHQYSAVLWAVIGYVTSQYYLLKSYQEYHAERKVFLAFFFLGASSLLFPKLLVMALFYYFSMQIQLRAFTLRTLLAGLFGLLAPLELYACVMSVLGQPEKCLEYIYHLVETGPLCLFSLKLDRWVNFGFLFVLYIISCAHYSRSNFNDKIRTRMCLYIVFLQAGVLLGCCVLQPQYYELFLPFIVAEISPLVGHYLTFSRGRGGSVFFYLILLSTFLVAAFNYLWMHSLISF